MTGFFEGLFMSALLASSNADAQGIILPLRDLLLKIPSIETKDYREKDRYNLGDWDEGKLEDLIAMAKYYPDIGDRIDFISEQFLGTPFKGGLIRMELDPVLSLLKRIYYHMIIIQ